jgi:hypothetical protein
MFSIHDGISAATTALQMPRNTEYRFQKKFVLPASVTLLLRHVALNSTCTLLILCLAVKLFPMQLTYVVRAPSFPIHFILVELSTLRKIRTIRPADIGSNWELLKPKDITLMTFVKEAQCYLAHVHRKSPLLWAAVAVPWSKAPLWWNRLCCNAKMWSY